ncbi:MAG: patatin-like phospholipase family protein [Acidimicrobiales bacterium]
MRPPVAVAYGGGGFFGIAYGLGVAHGLRDGGVELRHAPAIGTSAGSWVASAMVLDVGFDDFDALDAPSVPDRQSGLLAGAATRLFGTAKHPDVTAVAVPISTGRRRLLRGERHPLADLCAASSAVPGIFAPHRVGDQLYVDGGVRSGVSADLATAADGLVAIVPLGRPRLLDALVTREAAAWRRANRGARVTVIRPNREIAAQLGLNPMHLFDPGRAKAVYPLAVEQGRRWAARIRRAEAVAA